MFCLAATKSITFFFVWTYLNYNTTNIPLFWRSLLYSTDRIAQIGRNSKEYLYLVKVNSEFFPCSSQRIYVLTFSNSHSFHGQYNKLQGNLFQPGQKVAEYNYRSSQADLCLPLYLSQAASEHQRLRRDERSPNPPGTLMLSLWFSLQNHYLDSWHAIWLLMCHTEAHKESAFRRRPPRLPEHDVWHRSGLRSFFFPFTVRVLSLVKTRLGVKSETSRSWANVSSMND